MNEKNEQTKPWKGNVTVNGGQLGFLQVLTLIFIVLKLTRNIDWSWWWVLAPLWMPAAVFLAVFLVVFLVVVSSKAVLALVALWEKHRKTD